MKKLNIQLFATSTDVPTTDNEVILSLLNRRKMTEIVDTLRNDTRFDRMIRERDIIGEVTEHVQHALSSKGSHNIKSNTAVKYIDTLINKHYTNETFERVYYQSVSEERFARAMQSAESLAQFVRTLESKHQMSYNYDLTFQLRELMHSDTNIKGVLSEIPTLDEFKNMDLDTRRLTIENLLVDIKYRISDIRERSNKYITIETGMTEEEKGRFMAQADLSDLVMFIDNEVLSMFLIHFGASFNYELISPDLQMIPLDMRNDNRKIYIFHANRYTYRPTINTARMGLPLDADRRDLTLIVGGRMVNVPLYPAMVFVKDLETLNEPTLQGTEYGSLSSTSDIASLALDTLVNEDVNTKSIKALEKELKKLKKELAKKPKTPINEEKVEEDENERKIEVV